MPDTVSLLFVLFFSLLASIVLDLFYLRAFNSIKSDIKELRDIFNNILENCKVDKNDG